MLVSKPVVLVGTAIFAISSVMAGNSTSIDLFLMARFLQGIGAGFCYVVTFAILRDVLSPQRRTKALAAMNGVTCIAPYLPLSLGLPFYWSTIGQ